MKTIEIKVYRFAELEENVKEKVLEKFRESEWQWMDLWDANKTFEEFAKVFSIYRYNIDYLETYRNDYRFGLDKEVLNLSGVRLANHLWKHYHSYLYKGKYYGYLKAKEKRILHPCIESTKLKTGEWFNAYHSRITLVDSCVLTGCSYDDDILQPIYEFMRQPDDRTFKELLDDCIFHYCEAIAKEIEYQLSDEYLIDFITINDYWFREDGSIINS